MIAQKKLARARRLIE